MRILILNQFVPPDLAPTARLVGDLANGLRGDGHTVQVIGSPQNYRSKRVDGIRRLVREVRALTSIFWRALLSPRQDLVISTSSPPGLLLLATLVARLKRARSWHWAMDLHPELTFTVGRSVPSALADLAYSVFRVGYRLTDLVITLDRDMQKQIEKRYAKASAVIRPWNLHGDLPAVLPFPPRDPFHWIYSGNLGKAHEWLTLLDAQSRLEKESIPVKLIFQGSGAEWERARARAVALGLRNVEWRGYAPEDQMLSSLADSQILVVSQKPVTRGYLWPSKLGLVTRLPRHVLFVGPAGSIAEEVGAIPGAAAIPAGDGEQLAETIAGWYRNWPLTCSPAVRPGYEFPEAYAAWRKLLAGAGRA